MKKCFFSPGLNRSLNNQQRQLYKSRSLRRLLLFGLLLSLGVTVNAQAPAKSWDRTFGGSLGEDMNVLRQTADGGYILGGSSRSEASGDKSQPSQGGRDYWVVKINSMGVKEWDKTFGGAQDDLLFTIEQTPDGGYLLGGHSSSGISGDKTEASRGGIDQWVVKISSTGVKEWDKAFGGSLNDELYSLKKTSDGGYILAGTSESGVSGDKTESNWGLGDYWVVKIDNSGVKQWDKTFGSTGDDQAFSVQQTADGGYIIGGHSASAMYGDKSENSKGGDDYWLVKISSTGTKEWDRTIGANSSEHFAALQQTSDGGYIVGGHTPSIASGDKTEPTVGGADFWIVKLDNAGTKLWDKTYSGSLGERLGALQQTPDGGYMLAGYTQAGVGGDKTEPSKGGNDYWLIKVSSTGVKEWDKTIGGDWGDNLTSMELTSDGGIILGGHSFSEVAGDKTEPCRGGFDYWVVKLGGTVNSVPSAATIRESKVFPNPVTRGSVRLLVDNLPRATYTVRVVNSIGHQVAVREIDHRGGFLQTEIDMLHGGAGVYQLSLLTQNGETIVRHTVVKGE